MRTSRKQVERICEVMSTDKLHYRLIWSEFLSENSTYYKYRIVTDVPKYTDYIVTCVNPLQWKKITRNYITCYAYDKTILENASLKEAYDFMMNILENSLKEN